MALRPIALAAAVLAVASLPGAVAEAAPALEGGVMKMEIWLPDGQGSFELVDVGLEGRPYEHHFNAARCLCGQQIRDQSAPDADVQELTEFAAHMSFATLPAGEVDVSVQIWTGSLCDSATVDQRQCGDGPLEIINDDDVRNVINVPINVAELIDPENTGTCPTTDVTRSVYAMTDEEGDNQFDDVTTAEIKVDPEPPPIPTRFTNAAGGEGAITLEWVKPEGEVAYYWQALCARADGTPAPDANVPDPLYETTDVICNTASTHPAIPHIPVDGIDDLPDDALPPGLQELDGAYLCGQTIGDDTRIRIEGLENDVDYYVVLLAVDEAGNFNAATVDGVLTPKPATDFWEDLHENGSEAEGGFCLLADTYGEGGGPGGALTSLLRDFRDRTLADSGVGRWLTARYYDHAAPLGELARSSLIARIAFAVVLAPVVAIAVLWHLLTLPGLLALILAAVALRRMRRRGFEIGRWLRPALAGGAVLIAIGAAPSTARAQNFAPYWEDETPLEDDGPSAVKWHAAFKLGPFVPGIDQQLGNAEGEGPYGRMFGTDWKLLPVLEVDRFLAWPAGQLGVGGSIGFFTQSANAYEAVDPTPDDGVDDRSTGDKTRFRLLPLVLNGTYRFTMLDDDYGIPVVPYLRAGLAYYIWWITAPDGDFARVCDGTGTPDDGMCSLNEARGASLGVQGSLGLAIRAERVDKTAALSMRDSGLYHVGFFAEYQLAKVDGFGSNKKLAVGDSTWFAGIDFEF